MLLARSLKTLRLLAGSAVCVSSVVVYTGTAHADETAPPAATFAEATPPPAEPAPELPAPAADPPADAPADPAPAPSDAATEPAPVPSDPAPTDATTPPPNNTNDQQADVTNAGTSVANTGGNDAAANTNSNVAGAVGGSSASADAGTTTGNAGSTGSQATTQVDQIANATASDQAAIDILQVALVINLGVSNGQTGSNAAIAAGGQGGAGGTAEGAIDSGDASAVGNRAGTTVTQAAIVAGGEVSTQIAAVLNIGIGVGNTGLNVAMGTVTVDGISAAQLAMIQSGSAGVGTGSADALGNRSDTQILQSASGTASGTAVLQIGQWAIVLNFGTAFANTGGNLADAGAGPGGMSAAEYQAVLAIMNVLGPILDGLGGPGGTSVGNSTALITTGNAAAIGNDASTDINQMAAGAVGGDNYASATQRATVANIGLGLANTGYNAALANPGAWDLASLSPAANELNRFFGLLNDPTWLSSSNPFASFAQTIDLDGMTLELGGDISGVEFLLGWGDSLVSDGGPITPGVRVRQISAVLDIGIALANSGSNVSVAIVSGEHTTTSSDVQALLTTLATTNETTSATGAALARIGTGNASAVGSDAVVFICQAFHDDAACAPDPPTVGGSDPVTPPADPGQPESPIWAATRTPARVSANTGDPGAQLPFTGSDPQALLTAAIGLIGAGGLLARRRKQARA